jgi:hypothetical protein
MARTPPDPSILLLQEERRARLGYELAAKERAVFDEMGKDLDALAARMARVAAYQSPWGEPPKPAPKRPASLGETVVPFPLRKAN